MLPLINLARKGLERFALKAEVGNIVGSPEPWDMCTSNKHITNITHVLFVIV